MSIASKFLLWVALAFTAAIVALVAIPAKAVTIDTSRDCDKYAVMYCGSMTKAEIIKKLQNGDGQNSAKNIKEIYAKFNLDVNDIEAANFEKGVVYKSGEVKIGNKVVATNVKTYIRTMGKVSTSQMGTAQEALVAMDASGKFMFAVMTPCGNPVTGTPVEPPKPKPQTLTCDAVKVTITDAKNRVVSAAVTGSATNTTISAYKIDFGDGTVFDQQTANHTYANYGKYTIVAHVSGTVNGEAKTVTSAACAKEVEFAEPPKPVEQAITCDALTLDALNREKRYVKVTVKGSTANTTIDSYKIDFGDGTQPVSMQTAEHTYADYGTFKIVAHVSGTVNGQVVSVTGVNCAQTVSFTKTPDPCPTNPNLPIDDPKCKPCPTNPELNYDDPKCTTPPTPELPNTGAGSVLGLMSGVTILGAMGHRMWMNRKIGL
jgi:hypothetical protein